MRDFQSAVSYNTTIEHNHKPLKNRAILVRDFAGHIVVQHVDVYIVHLNVFVCTALNSNWCGICKADKYKSHESIQSNRIGTKSLLNACKMQKKLYANKSHNNSSMHF